MAGETKAGSNHPLTFEPHPTPRLSHIKSSNCTVVAILIREVGIVPWICLGLYPWSLLSVAHVRIRYLDICGVCILSPTRDVPPSASITTVLQPIAIAFSLSRMQNTLHLALLRMIHALANETLARVITRTRREGFRRTHQGSWSCRPHSGSDTRCQIRCRTLLHALGSSL